MVKQEKGRYRVTLNFNAEQFKLFKEASELLDMSPGQLIKQSLLQDSVTDLLKLLITNKDTILKTKQTYLDLEKYKNENELK